jgi:hypothetical protein
MSVVARSYVKTTLACFALAVAASAFATFALLWLPRVVGSAIAALSALVALVAIVFAATGELVRYRHRLGAHSKRDLFLELNRSREASAIAAGAGPRTGWLRRWLARRFLGHDLVVGDEVEIRPWAEIRATLDERGCLEELPFMPEMLAMCGQRAHVFRCVHRIFDYRKSRRMRHMDRAVLLVGTVCDGSSHGGCEAACHTIWKPAWLRTVAPGTVRTPAAATLPEAQGREVLRFGTQFDARFDPARPRYACQLTQLHAASQPIDRLALRHFLLPVVSGNVAPAAFVVGWLTHLFNKLQHRRQGIGFPQFEPPGREPGPAGHEEPPLQAGDPVRVLSPAEIRATLNERHMHRGMWFEPDMMKHCGHRYRVQAEIRKIVDIVNGEMRTMKTPAYVLRDVHFSGERQLFNAQYEPLFWRAAWLRREPHSDSAS